MATTTQTQPQAVPGTATFVGRPVERPVIRTLRRFAKHRMAVVGVIVIAILIILAIVGNEAEALKQNLAQANKPPSPEHWWGTDRNGRDILAPAAAHLLCGGDPAASSSSIPSWRR